MGISLDAIIANLHQEKLVLHEIPRWITGVNMVESFQNELKKRTYNELFIIYVPEYKMYMLAIHFQPKQETLVTTYVKVFKKV